MATYAAYRHVELDKVGCGKRSIMKPPGGDCHDIFGAAFHGTPSHHRVLKPPGGGTSSLFANPAEEDPKPETPLQNDGTQNLASEVLNGSENMNGKNGNPNCSSSLENAKDDDFIYPPSPRIISQEVKRLVAQVNMKKRNSRNPVTGAGFENVSEVPSTRVHRQRDGNPVTGEGYDARNNSSQNSSAQVVRTRIPPGGYSSGLW